MAGLNKVILIGHLGKDPEIQIFESNTKKAAFSLATSESYRDKEGNRVDKTEWHSIVVWRGQAELAERYLHKGSKIYLEGKIRTRNYQDQTGATRYVTEIVGDNIIMLDRREDNGTYPPTKSTQPTTAQPFPPQTTGFTPKTAPANTQQPFNPPFAPVDDDPFSLPDVPPETDDLPF